MKKNLRRKAMLAVMTSLSSLSSLMLALALTPSGYAQTVRQAAGSTPADIQSAVDEFRTDLGGANNGIGGTFTTGRREINWDGVPDAASAPNNLQANFFNVNSQRGLILATPGSGFQVSAKAGNATSTAVEFGNLNPAFPGLFRTFSPERLFIAIGSNVTDVLFFVPGTATPAVVSGFGVVFSDVERNDSAKLEFFDAQGRLLFSGFAPAGSSVHESLSFIGASFTTPQIAVVRITSGTTVLDAQAVNDANNDLVAMDDFIYGEPQAVNTSSTCGATVCFASPSFRASQLRRSHNAVRGALKVPNANKGLPVGVNHPSVLLALDPSPFLASQPRTQLIASYVAAELSLLDFPSGGSTGGATTLSCYGSSIPVTLSNGLVIRSFTTISQLILETENAFRQGQGDDVNKLLSVYQKLQSNCTQR
ncbi:MAG: hypothetical protein ABIU20_07120 [Blastocatellia bacterium]